MSRCVLVEKNEVAEHTTETAVFQVALSLLSYGTQSVENFYHLLLDTVLAKGKVERADKVMVNKCHFVRARRRLPEIRRSEGTPHGQGSGSGRVSYGDSEEGTMRWGRSGFLYNGGGHEFGDCTPEGKGEY